MIVSMNYLLEAGVHFGHQKRRWNPKMKPYIYTTRDDIYIIDLQKTVKEMEKAYAKMEEIATNGGKFLFVGTKKQAQEAVEECAVRTDQYFINQRWLGGTLTNFKTIRSRIKRLDEIEKMEADGTFDLLPKKEVIGIKKEYEKLNRNLRGIRKMESYPQALVIVDPRKEEIAIREAHNLNIPVFGVVDTNCDPDLVDYVIPGNDDAVRSVKLLLGVLTNSIAVPNNKEVIDYITPEDKVREQKRKDRKNNNFNNNNHHDKKESKEVKTETLPKIEVKEVKEKVEEPKKEEIKEPKREIKKEAKKEPKKADLETLTLVELKNIAKEKAIKGYSTMKKADLIKALKD